MLKKKIATAGIALAVACSVAACADGEDVDGTWKAKDQTIDVKDGRYKVTSTAKDAEFSFEGDVDYENQEIVISSEDVFEAMKEEMTDEEIAEIEKNMAGEKKEERSKYNIDGDTMTIEGDEYHRED